MHFSRGASIFKPGLLDFFHINKHLPALANGAHTMLIKLITAR